MHNLTRAVTFFVCAVLIMVVLGACSEREKAGDIKPVSEVDEPLSMPENNAKKPEEAKTILAMYEGTLPAADAAGIHHVLSLFDDDTYHLIRTYLGKPEGENTFEEEGVFTTQTGFEDDSDAILYILQPEDELNRITFLETTLDSILLLDREQQRIDSALNYQLDRVFP